MKERPAQETLESLRLTLLKVEQGAEPEQDAEALAELKRILLQRIAELEAVQALESAAAQTLDGPSSDQSNPEALLPPPAATSIQADSAAAIPAADSKDVASDAGPSTTPSKPD